ncbi:hypothetical protein SELMODRAFT_105905, partial [Selaginella moellendorffii]
TVKLLYCASRGDVEGLRQALREGVNKDVADYDKRTALHLAASEGHADCVLLLIQHGVDLSPRDRWGRTPLADARRYGHMRICKLLEAHEAMDYVMILISFVKESVVPEYEIDPGEIERIGNNDPIGRGAFGEIRVVKWRGTKVAAKTILTSLLQDKQVVREFVRELVLLQKLHHPNIVQFLGAVTKQENLIIITEYLPKGDLQALLRRKSKGSLGGKQVLHFALDIARGMNFLHEHKPEPVIHRDLKPTNILLDDAGHLKVGDFGLSRLVKASGATVDEVYKMTGETGSSDRYMAPEVFKHQSYDKSVDVYSFALIVYEMFEGHVGNRYENPIHAVEDRARHGYKPAFTAKYPTNMKQLLTRCLDFDAKKRPSFREIIAELEDMERSQKFGCSIS